MTGTATRVLSQMLLILILMMVAMILKDTSKCRANDTSRNDTNIIVFQDDLKMEFQMDSESNQKVLASTKHKTYNIYESLPSLDNSISTPLQSSISKQVPLSSLLVDLYQHGIQRNKLTTQNKERTLFLNKTSHRPNKQHTTTWKMPFFVPFIGLYCPKFV